MNDFPSSWAHVFLGDVLDKIEAGRSFAGEPRPAEADEWGIIKVSAITYGTFREHENKAVPRGTKFSEAAEVRPGDLLVSRANTRDYVGASVLVGDCRPRLLLSDKSLRLHPSAAVDRRWLWYALNTPKARQYLSDASTGVKSGMRNISQSSLRAMPLALPPPEEQRRIVDILEDHLSHLDAAECYLGEARKRSIAYHSALIVCGLRGQLVQDDLAEGSGHDLLKICGVDPLAFEANEDDRIWDTPSTWAWTRIGDVFKVYVGATPSRARNELWNGYLPWVSSGEVAFNRINRTRETIQRAAAGNPTTRIHPPGTVMLAMIGEGKTRGQAAILDIEAAHNQNCASIRVSETPILPEYVFAILQERYLVTRRAASGGNQPALNKAAVRNIPIPVAPLITQRLLVEKFASGGYSAERLSQEISQAFIRSAKLRRALLSAAFSGGLTGRASDIDLVEEMVGV